MIPFTILEYGNKAKFGFFLDKPFQAEEYGTPEGIFSYFYIPEKKL